MDYVTGSIISAMGFTDLVDIAIVAFIVYKILGFIRETRAEQLVKGLLILVIGAFLSEVFNLYTLSWLLRGVMTVGLIALVVVFQPELRRGLEYLGRSKILTGPFSQMDKDDAKHITSEFVKAIEDCSTKHVGALIVIERNTSLTDIIETGTVIDAAIDKEMICNIFYEGAPLHDGALIVRGDRLHAAGCVLPLTQNKALSKDLGTRHRAGIGITENSDALTIIVSEETGIISVAEDGKLTRFLDKKNIEKILLNTYLSGAEDTKQLGIFEMLRRLREVLNNASK
jgi:diadenylate cyclase